MRLATWNIEWFDRLFRDGHELDDTDEWSSRYQITKARQLRAIAEVMHYIDADALLVIEAPDDGPDSSTRVALETFAEWADLRIRRAMIGFPNQTRQEIALMYDPDRVTPRHSPGDHPEAPRFDGELGYDLDTDLRADRLVWSKPPLEVDLTVGEATLHLIGVHAKSKGVHGATGQDALRISILNRRKQLAQCIWLRRRIEARLAEGVRLVVAGDFNDGPGLDKFESLFGRSGVEIVLGEGDDALHDPSATVPRIGAALPSTARFWDNSAKRYMNALLDFAMVSNGLRPHCTWRILHPFDDPQAARTPGLQQALLAASDHFPVILDVDPAALDVAVRPPHL